MARPIYSRSILAVTVFGGTPASIDLPAPSTWVIREITANFANPALPNGAALFFALGGLAFASFHVPSYFNECLSWSGRVVAPGPTALGVNFSGPGGVCVVTVSGYELSA